MKTKPSLEALFQRFRDSDDVEALGRLFDRTAPELYSVARHLVRPDDVDDLVQTTYVQAIEGAATWDPCRRVLPWLLGILANRAHKLQRDRGRATRPELLERPRAADESTSKAATNELHCALRSALAELPAKVALTLGLHLEQGYTPAEIAERLGEAQGTVRVRLHRGLKVLRRALPPGLAGGGLLALFESARPASAGSLRALRRGVLGAAGRPAASVGPSAVAVAKAALLLGLVGAGGVAWAAWRAVADAAEPPSIARPVHAPSAPSDPSRGSTGDLVPPEPPSSARAALATDARDARAERSRAGPTGAAPARLTGRILLPDGRPAGGVALRLHGWEGNSERVLEHGVPDDWEDVLAESEDDGTFDVRFDPPRAFQFTLEARLAGYARTGWRWGEILPREEKELGDTVLSEAGAIVGSIVDGRGALPAGSWSVSATWGARELGRELEGRDHGRALAKVDPSTGEFRIEEVAAGRVEVGAGGFGGASVAKVVIVPPREEVSVELVYEGPDLARRVVVMPTARPFHARLEASALRLLDPAGALHPPGHDRALEWVFDDLDPELLYRVEIRDPRYEPWTQEGVRAGDTVQATLKGNAALRVRVIDGETGAPVTGYALLAELPNQSPRVELLARDTPHGDEVRIDGLPSGEPFTLETHIPESLEGRATVESLSPAEERVVCLVVPRGTPLVGRVVGSPTLSAADASIEWTRGPRAGVPGDMHDSSGRIRSVASVVACDAQGQFRLERVDPGQHTLRARWSPWVYVDRTLTHPVPEGEEVVLEAPPAGFLAGRLQLPEGRPVDDLRLDIKHDADPSAWFRSGRRVPGGGILPDGTFRYGPLPVGSVRVQLVVDVPVGNGMVGSFFPLDQVSIPPDGTASRTWDVRETFPGSIRPRVTIDGDQALEGWIWHWRERGVGPDVGLDGGGCPLGQDAIVLGGLRPGPWHVAVVGPAKEWMTMPREVAVEAARTTDLDIDVVLLERTVRFLDARSGTALIGRRVSWASVLPSSAYAPRDIPGGSATTDDAGTLTLSLPAGAVRFSREDAGDVWSVPIDWGARAEPVVSLP